MKKYFYYAMAVMTLSSLAFTSCDDDDDDSSKKESSTPANPQTLGQQSQSVIEKMGDGSEEDMMASVDDLTDADVLQAAKVLVEYNKNKANESWVKSFTEAAATEKISADQIKTMLDDAVSSLVEMGMLKDNVSASDLATAIKVLKGGNGQNSGNGTADALPYKSVFGKYKDQILAMDPTDFGTLAKLPEDVQGQLVSAMMTYNSNKDNATWVKDFISSITKDGYSSDEATQLGKLFKDMSGVLSMGGM